MTKELIIRLALEGAEPFEDYRLGFQADHFGGHIPSVGDLIIDPLAPQGADRRVPANRTVLQVVGRYFLPAFGEDENPFAVLIVRPRAGRPAEINILAD
jgi:hypothetical protein